ncbi:hypothetical protein FJD38_19855 [Pseudomonas saxonica]|uniref:Uncharacterized protein n=1 Tax=Pseudomonas saxonica TaxID=2600598 RepID=A0ABY3GDK4_9PSED|nr:hypothetical protein FJD38_19855 [Pseudomonas saxonica]
MPVKATQCAGQIRCKRLVKSNANWWSSPCNYALKPGAWVFPATEQADRILDNPEHPPEYQDFII